jgi:CheY-like chemotaxis protein
MPVPTLVFLDLMMPSMNGWEFLDARKKDQNLDRHKVVTISAVDSSESLDDPTPLKVDGAIAKPLSLERIWTNVNKYCRPTPALAS